MNKRVLILTVISLLIISCKSETKKETEKTIKTVVKKAPLFSLKNATNFIGWTAYKTTKKIGVKGQFKEVNITANGEGNSIKEAINGTEFSIPVSSIFTKDENRDFKIRKFFFGVMDNSELLSGKLSINNDTKGEAEIKMNGVTQKVPFTYTINNKAFYMSATINIEDWKASKALSSLNKACKDLHKGPDGVSKTWNEVTLNISSTFN